MDLVISELHLIIIKLVIFSTLTCYVEDPNGNVLEIKTMTIYQEMI